MDVFLFCLILLDADSSVPLVHARLCRSFHHHHGTLYHDFLALDLPCFSPHAPPDFSPPLKLSRSCRVSTLRLLARGVASGSSPRTVGRQLGVGQLAERRDRVSPTRRAPRVDSLFRRTLRPHRLHDGVDEHSVCVDWHQRSRCRGTRAAA